MSVEVILLVIAGVVSLTLLLQCFLFWGTYRSIRELCGQIDHLSADVKSSIESISGKADSVVSTILTLGESVRGMRENLTATTAVIQRRVTELDAFLEETTDAARLQVMRIQDLVDNTSRSVEETFELLQRSVVTPISELNAIVTGIRVALQVLAGKKRGPAGTAHQDEEMFI